MPHNGEAQVGGHDGENQGLSQIPLLSPLLGVTHSLIFPKSKTLTQKAKENMSISVPGMRLTARKIGRTPPLRLAKPHWAGLWTPARAQHPSLPLQLLTAFQLAQHPGRRQGSRTRQLLLLSPFLLLRPPTPATCPRSRLWQTLVPEIHGEELLCALTSCTPRPPLNTDEPDQGEGHKGKRLGDS